MQVTVSFLGPLREHLEEASFAVELPVGATYRQLLDTIGPVMSEQLPDWAWDRNTGSFSRQITVSSNLSSDLRSMSARLADGDQILVFLLMAGG